MTNNYHTHTFRCKHAVGDVSDYARVAVAKGVTVLGISDHTPLPDNKWLHVRMDIGELNDYIRAIENAQREFPNLTILKGLECDYSDEYYDFYKDFILGELGFDFLISGAHWYPIDGSWAAVYGGIINTKELHAYADYVVKSMESQLFDFIAHPDLFGNCYEKWDENTVSISRYILEAASSYKIPLEINAYGLRKPYIEVNNQIRPMYPWEKFWELASEYDISAIINSDAHCPNDVLADIEEASMIAKKHNINIADMTYLEGK